MQITRETSRAWVLFNIALTERNMKLIFNHMETPRKKTAFQRTKPSTVKLIKASVAENKRPLKVLKEVGNFARGCDASQTEL